MHFPHFPTIPFVEEYNNIKLACWRISHRCAVKDVQNICQSNLHTPATVQWWIGSCACMHQLLIIRRVNEKKKNGLYIYTFYRQHFSRWWIIWCETATSPKLSANPSGSRAHKRMKLNKATQRVISDNLWVRVEEFLLYTAVELSTQSTSGSWIYHEKRAAS